MVSGTLIGYVSSGDYMLNLGIVSEESIDDVRCLIYDLWAKEESKYLDNEEDRLECYNDVADNIKYIDTEDCESVTIFKFVDFTFYGHPATFILLKDKSYEKI